MGNVLSWPFRRARAIIYDALILRLTTRWYEVVLSQLDFGSTILDVGIGTAGALVRCKDILLERKIKVVGLDYDEDYVLMARKTIEQHGLQHYVSAVHMSVYDAQTLQTQLQIPGEANSLQPRFDAIYFSGSFSLLPDWAGALISVSPLLKSKGHIFITQTYQRYTPPLLKYIKPLLRYITTINFGELVSETRAAEFFQHQVPEKCHLECVDHEVIKGSVDTSLQAAFITKLRPIQK